MAVLLGAIRGGKYFVYFGSKKLEGFNTYSEARRYSFMLEERGYPYLMIRIKHKGKFIN